MKLIHWLYLPLVITFVLSGCVPASSTMIPTQVETQLPSPTFIQSTSTPIITLRETATLTPPATLEPEKAKETMRILLQEPVDCPAPCFWGITPEQTTLGEAKNIFTHLGLQIKSTTFQGKDFYGVAYDFDNLSISGNLAVQDDIVRSLTVNIHPEKQQVGIPREWSAYSPETLIKRYDLPSEVDLVADSGPNLSYGLIMYFNTVDLIVEYHSFDLYSSMRICPQTDQIDSVRIWMGDNPQYPPTYGIPLEEAASMTLKDFLDLMKGDPNKACFNLDAEKFQ